MRTTQAQKLALVLQHGTFEALTETDPCNGFTTYRFTPYDQVNAEALNFTQAAANPFTVINNVIDFFGFNNKVL